ncbi:hypothetical protein [Pseudomonas sp. Fl4BN1]|uniref:hypothetical protein n=1 Tax=Pseudomonas sp. Fl4BN1 TaxID=2697651 RepID=UPI001376B08B|nr:hypothetical protein [Pseudomonas sp. Fl4BN1]NBF07857.1 hypothetical protein [Pseudomonas sp. Fl4BN1]
MQSSRSLAMLLLVTLFAGCMHVPSLPELRARSQWQQRSAQDALDFFGPPGRMVPTADGQQVVMSWYHDTTYVRQEVVAQGSQMQGNVMVHTNYMDDVEHPGSCVVSITVDKAKRVVDFGVRGRCYSVELGPS